MFIPHKRRLAELRQSDVFRDEDSTDVGVNSVSTGSRFNPLP